MMKKPKNTPQRKTTLKWNVNGELSSIDMARILEALSVKELSQCEFACNIEPKKLNGRRITSSHDIEAAK